MYRLDGLHIFSFDFQSGPYRVWLARWMLVPFVSFQDCHGWLMLIVVFLQGLSQHLVYLVSLAYQPCPIWTIAWGICSVLGDPFIFAVRRFPEEALKLSANFLIMLPVFSEKGALEMLENLLAVSAQSGFVCPLRPLQGGLIYCGRIAWSSDWSSGGVISGESCFFISSLWWKGDPKSSEWLLYLYFGSLLPALFFPQIMTENFLMGFLIVPKVPNFLGGSPKLSKGLLHDCKRRPRKSAPFLMSYSYHDG